MKELLKVHKALSFEEFCFHAYSSCKRFFILFSKELQPRDVIYSITCIMRYE